MSRGLGHIQRSILAALETDIDGAWTVSQICERVYPGIDRIEKKHRVAVARAIRKMVLPGTWHTRMVYASGAEYCVCNECSLISMARLDWFGHITGYYGKQYDFAEYMAGWSHKFEPGGNTYDAVERAKRYRDGSEIDRLDMQIENTSKCVSLCAMGGTPSAAAAARKYADHLTSLTKRRDELKEAAA
jgi:hypothetical protein